MVNLGYDEFGYLAKSLGLRAVFGPIDGTYTMTGLRPGLYYLFASIYDDSMSYHANQWYGQTRGNQFIFRPKVEIPKDAKPIIVQQGLVKNIDFYFALPTSVSNQDPSLTVYQYRLLQNYPNPFNPRTTIQFETPRRSKVLLAVYDVLGRRIETLQNAWQNPGVYSVIWDATRYTSGIYFIRLEAGSFQKTIKALLLK